MKKLRNILENRIWILAAVMLSALLVLSNGSELFMSSLALEQNARCGLTEHVHGEECYYRDILICKEKSHVHSERCYLVLLEENDINSLLIKVDAMPGNSMETLIAQVLDRAIWYGWYGEEDLSYTTSGGAFASSAAASSAAQLWNQYTASSAASSAAGSASSSSGGGLWGLFGSSSGSAGAATDSSASNTWSFFGSSSSSSGRWSFFGSSGSSSGRWSFFGSSSSAGASSSGSWTFFAAASSSQDGAASSGELSLFAASENGGVVEADIAELNANVVRGNIVPNVVLNEGLTTMALVPQDTQVIAVPAPGSSGGISTLAIGDDLVDNDGAVANFYIYLDKSKFVCIGNVPVNDNGSNDYATKNNIANLFNTEEIVSNVTSGELEKGTGASDDIQIRYTATQPGENAQASTFGIDANRVGSSSTNRNRINFGSVISWDYWEGTTYSPRYATLMTGSGNNRPTYTPINFYTVTLDYSQSGTTTANKVQYVQSGQNSTLTLDETYFWYTDPADTTTLVTETALQDIDSKTTLYAKPKNHTVKYVDENNVQIGSAVVEHDDDHKVYALPTTGNGYRCWKDGVTEYDPGEIIYNIKKDITLRAVPWMSYTVTYLDEDGSTYENVTVSEKSPTHSILPPLANCIWIDEDGNEITVSSVTVTEDRTFTAVPANYTVTYLDADGNEITEKSATVHYQGNHAVSNLPAGCKYWTDGKEPYTPDDEISDIKENITLKAVKAEIYTVTYKDEAGNALDTIKVSELDNLIALRELPEGYNSWSCGENTYEPGDTYTVTGDITFTAEKRYTVTFQYPNDVETKKVYHGETVTIPDGYIWTDGVNRYNSGDEVVITEDTVFTALKSLVVNYNVNYTASGFTGNPVLMGDGNADNVTEGDTLALRKVSPDMTTKQVSNTNGEKVIMQFLGWKVDGTDEVFKPGAVLTWEELEAYAENGSVDLVGIWAGGGAIQSLNFFIRYDSVAANTGENFGGQDTTLYTNSLFQTYVSAPAKGGLSNDAYNRNNGITDSTADNSLTADQNIRDRYLSKVQREADGEIWIMSFPDDEYVFEYLRGDTKDDIKIEGTVIGKDMLTSENYAIRWYVMKLEGSSWHIDGKLVKKEATVVVKKTFDGKKDLVAAAKNGFTITATRGTMVDKVFQPDSDTNANTKTLTMTESKNKGADGGYVEYDKATDTYTWRLTGVKAGEHWQLKENMVNVNGALGVGEWVIVDSSNNQSGNGIGEATTLIGVAYAVDTDPDGWLHTEFTNVYHTKNSLLLRKVDANTGGKLDGAVFKFYQGGSETPMTFDKATADNSALGVLAGQYVWNPNGNGAYTEILCDGTEIALNSFTFDYGSIEICEVTPPAGYGLAQSVHIGKYKDSNGNDVIGFVDETGKPVTHPHATYNEGLVVIKDSAETTSYTVEKAWNCPASERTDRVTIQLLANDSIGQASSYAPTGTATQVELSSTNNWTYTWTNLPVYANGAAVKWSVRELKVGDETIFNSGTESEPEWTFTNWNATYGKERYSYDEDGVLVNTAVTVTNTPKTGAFLILEKMDDGKTVTLGGAAFELRRMSSITAGDTQVDNTFAARTMTTDENGILVFQNLQFNRRYQLTEITAPAGYLPLEEPIWFTIDPSGKVTVEGIRVEAAGAYAIIVRNINVQPLPETGGTGTALYQWSGLLLMAAAALLFIDKRPRRKEGKPS